MNGEDATPPIPMGRIIGKEIEIVGSLGMQFHKYPEMFAMISSGKLRPQELIGRTVTLEEAASVLPAMNNFSDTGMSIIENLA